MIKRDEKDLEEQYRSKYKQAIDLCRNHRFNETFNLCECSYDSEDNNEIGDIEAKQQDFRQSFTETGERSFITFPEFLMMVIDIYLNLSGTYSFYRNELLNIYDSHSIPDKQDFTISFFSTDCCLTIILFIKKVVKLQTSMTSFSRKVHQQRH